MLSSKHGSYQNIGFRRDKKTVDEKGYTIMTLDYLRQLCKEQKGYVTPYLNDTLYLHYKGFAKITSDITHYSGLKSLWLECNALSELDHLDALKELRCLYLQENCLSTLNGIGELKHLTILNISQNVFQELPEVLADLPNLTNLHASHNKLKTKQNIQVLALCPSLTVLDLNHNALESVDVLEVMYQMPQLSVLTLQANPFLAQMHHYRKTCILNIPTLTYLEDRPVSENERKATEAWQVGGVEAEREERARLRREEQEEHQAGFLRLAQLQREARARRAPSPPVSYSPAIQRFHDEMVAKIESPLVACAEEGEALHSSPSSWSSSWSEFDPVVKDTDSLSIKEVIHSKVNEKEEQDEKEKTGKEKETNVAFLNVDSKLSMKETQDSIPDLERVQDHTNKREQEEDKDNDEDELEPSLPPIRQQQGVLQLNGQPFLVTSSSSSSSSCTSSSASSNSFKATLTDGLSKLSKTLNQRSSESSHFSISEEKEEHLPQTESLEPFISLKENKSVSGVEELMIQEIQSKKINHTQKTAWK